MIQSGEYIPCGEFISIYKKTDLSEAQVLWDMIHKPAQTTIDMVIKLMFNFNSVSSRKRYYTENNTSSNTSDVLTNPLPEGINAASRLINLCRSVPRPESNPEHINEDYIALPELTLYDNIFTIDTVGEPVQEPVTSFECPDNIEDMIVIVRRTRRQIEQSQIQASVPRTFQSSSSSSSPPPSSSSSSSLDRNNYDQIIPSNF